MILTTKISRTKSFQHRQYHTRYHTNTAAVYTDWLTNVCQYHHQHRTCIHILNFYAGFPGSTSTQITSTTQATQTTPHLGTMDSATVSATPTQQQSTNGQTGLPVSTIIILSTVIPSTLVLLMLVCTVVVIILIVRWRISRKQVDAALEHKGKYAL